MYIEDKSGGLNGQCQIGRVTFSKTGATLRYDGQSFQSLKGYGFKANYFDVETGAQFWISGPRKDGADGLYGRITQPEDVDADVADEYWRLVRGVDPAPAGHGLGFGDQVAVQAEVQTGRGAQRVARQRAGHPDILNVGD